MTTPAPSPTEGPITLREIFLSPGESRLRSGWRLLLHGLLTAILVLLFGAVLSVIGAALGIVDFTGMDPDSLDSPYLLLAPLAAITLATWLARRHLDRRSFQSLGLVVDQHAVTDLLLGMLMPAGLFALVFFVEMAFGWLQVTGTAFESSSLAQVLGHLIQGLVVFIIVGYQEELLSRGYQLQNLAPSLGLPLATFISSGVFALMHIFNPGASVVSTLGILAAGFFLALGWLRTGQLWLPIGLHIGWNYFQGTIFGFAVSGTAGFHLIEHSVQGPVLLTGGSFGPEAGLTGWLAMALGAYAIWRYTQGRGGPLAGDWDDGPQDPDQGSTQAERSH